MTERIYLSSPDITSAEEEGLLRALRSGWVAPLGPEVDAFEVELAEFTGRPHAVAVSVPPIDRSELSDLALTVGEQ